MAIFASIGKARSFGYCAKTDGLGLWGRQGRDVFCPASKRFAYLGRISSAVIYARNARPVAADVV